jgi:hypothetical protein
MHALRPFRWRPKWLQHIEFRVKASLAKQSLKRIARSAALREEILRQPWAQDAILEAMRSAEDRVRGQTTAEYDARIAETLTGTNERIAREYATSQKPWHWEQRRWEQRPKKRFLFIVGCGHSGTTIVHRLLSEHPQVHGIVKESNLFLDFTDDKILEQLRTWERDADEAGKDVVLEKTPFHLYYFNRINEFAENCSFLSVIRDGRDVVASYIASGHPQQWAVNYWTQCMRYEDEIAATLKQHQRVRLEDLVADPKATLSRVLQHLNLDATPDVVSGLLDYHKRPKAYYHEMIEKPPNALEGENMAKHRTYQVNQPLFTSTSRWQQEIPQRDWPALNESLMPWLHTLGYHCE